MPRSDSGRAGYGAKFLNFNRESALPKSDGLDDELLRHVLVGTGTNLHGLIRHLAAAERSCFGLHLTGIKHPGSYKFGMSSASPRYRHASEVKTAAMGTTPVSIGARTGARPRREAIPRPQFALAIPVVLQVVFTSQCNWPSRSIFSAWPDFAVPVCFASPACTFPAMTAASSLRRWKPTTSKARMFLTFARGLASWRSQQRG